MIPAEATMRALVGHRFPGGRYRIEHWENFLFSEATGAEPLPGGLAHPAHLFHVAINGAGTSIAELFRLAESAPGAPVSIDHYDWQLQRPLREDETYSCEGGITSHERTTRGDRVRDSFTYEIALHDPDGAPVAKVGFGWHFWRVDAEGASEA